MLRKVTISWIPPPTQIICLLIPNHVIDPCKYDSSPRSHFGSVFPRVQLCVARSWLSRPGVFFLVRGFPVRGFPEHCIIACPLAKMATMTQHITRALFLAMGKATSRGKIAKGSLKPHRFLAVLGGEVRCKSLLPAGREQASMRRSRWQKTSS